MQRYSTNAKRCPPKKVFGNSEFCSSRQNHSRPKNFGFGGKNKTQSFQKLFSGDIFLYLLNMFATAAPKVKAKNIKNYCSILAVVNHRNWLDNSPPLTHIFHCTKLSTCCDGQPDERRASRTQKTLLCIIVVKKTQAASWLSCNAFVSGAEGLRFKSWAGQIGHSVINCLPPLQYFFDWS